MRLKKSSIDFDSIRMAHVYVVYLLKGWQERCMFIEEKSGVNKLKLMCSFKLRYPGYLVIRK